MRILWLLSLFTFLATFSFAGKPAPPDPLAVMAEFDRETATELWPGFAPKNIAIAIFDGKQTWLFHQSGPPDGFSELAQHRDIFIYNGRHPSVKSNTNVELNGIGTAAVDLSDIRKQPISEQAALLVHEAFHVFQHERHPKWTANEADLFMYPLDNAGFLQHRREETESLRRALLARSKDESVCWAAETIRIRDLRFTALSPSAAAYERATELHEGLANYLQVRAAGTANSFTLPQGGFPADSVRQRSYATGAALALLLDRTAPGWQKEMESGQPGSLDQLLKTKLYFAASPCAISETDEAAISNNARADVDALKKRLERKKSDVLTALGWQIIVASNSPQVMNAEGFDPMNVSLVAPGEVLHQRWIKLSNGDGSVEVLNRASLSNSAGNHPLLDGVKQLTVTGLKDRPTISIDGGMVRVYAEGVRAEFRHALVRTEGRKVLIEVGQQHTLQTQ